MLQHRKWSLASAGGERVSAESETAPGVAAELRLARQRLGWTIEQVAAALRIRAPYLQALEDGRLRDVPGNAYAVAFTRAYARCLGLDADETVRRLRAEMEELNRKPVLIFPMPVPERGVPAGAMVLLGVVLAVFAYAGWYYMSGNMPAPAENVASLPDRLAPLAGESAAPPPPATSPQIASIEPETPPASAQPTAPTAPYVPPAVAPSQAAAMTLPTPLYVPPSPPAPPPAPTDTPRLVLRAKADSWLLIRDKSGPVLLNRVLHPGETWTPPADHPTLLMTTGVLKALPVAAPASTARPAVQ